MDFSTLIVSVLKKTLKGKNDKKNCEKPDSAEEHA